MPAKNAVITFLADIEVDEIQAAETAADKGPRKFKSTAYTGGALAVDAYDLPIVVDLAGMTPAKSIVANLHHDRKQIVGHVPDVTNNGKTLKMSGLVSGTGAAAEEFTANHDNGFPWQASIEAKPSQVDYVADGNSVKVNGQSFDGPLYVARKSKLYGVAFVPRGADENTGVSIAAEAAQKKGRNEMKFNEWIEAMGLEADKLTEKQIGLLQSKYDKELLQAHVATLDKPGSPPPVVAAPVFDLDDVRAAGEEFLAELECKFAEYEADTVDAKQFATIKAAGLKAARSLRKQAIADKWPAARLEVEAAKATAKIEIDLHKTTFTPGPAINASRRDESPNVIEAALCIQRGLPGIEKQFDEKTLDAAHKHYRNIGLQQVLIMAADANGYRIGTGERIHNGNIERILRYALPKIDAEGGSSTMGVSLSNMLQNLANKELLIGYTQDDEAWKEVSVTKSVTDFKAVTSYRLLDNMEYEEVGPNGEIKSGTVGQESYTRQAKTYAKMFGLTRTDIINDDLGAFDDLRRRVGVGSSLKLNRVFWTKFLASLATLFTAGQGNYITGATTTLLTDGVGLELALMKFLTMTSGTVDDNKRIGGRPSILLHPPELSFVADRIYSSQNLVGEGGGSNVAVPSTNIHANKYKPVMAPCLSDSTFANNTATGWGLFRNPAMYAAMVVSFLNGQQTPTVQSADTDFDILGIQFRGFHDFGVDTAEHVAGVWSKGAA